MGSWHLSRAEAASVRRPIVLLRQVRVPESGAPLQGSTSAGDQICFLGDEGSLVSLWLHGGFMVYSWRYHGIYIYKYQHIYILFLHLHIYINCKIIYIYIFLNYILYNYRRKFRSQTCDNMDRWKAEVGRVREEKRRRKKIREEKESEERRSEKRKSQKKEYQRRERVRRKKMQGREKVEKSRITVAKAAGAEPSGQLRDEQLHAVVARSTFPSQNVQTPQRRTAFGSWHVEKAHAVVARSTFSKSKC